MNSGVTRTILDPPVDIVECYTTMMKNHKDHELTRPLLPPPPPPPLISRMPFCRDDDYEDEQIYEAPDPTSWHIDV